MLSRWREILLWGLCFAALFAFGWWRGSHPDFKWSGLLGPDQPLIVLTPDPAWIPPGFLIRLSRETGLQFQLEKIDDFADFEARLVPLDAPALVWLPSTWAKGLASQSLLLPFGDAPDLPARVHPDFRERESNGSEAFLAVLWKQQDNELRVEGLALPTNGKNRLAALRALRAWTSPELAKLQVLGSDANSALEFSSHSDLPFERRADALRNQPLSGIKEKR